MSARLRPRPRVRLRYPPSLPRQRGGSIGYVVPLDEMNCIAYSVGEPPHSNLPLEKGNAGIAAGDNSPSPSGGSLGWGWFCHYFARNSRVSPSTRSTSSMLL